MLFQISFVSIKVINLARLFFQFFLTAAQLFGELLHSRLNLLFKFLFLNFPTTDFLSFVCELLLERLMKLLLQLCATSQLFDLFSILIFNRLLLIRVLLLLRLQVGIMVFYLELQFSNTSSIFSRQMFQVFLMLLMFQFFSFENHHFTFKLFHFILHFFNITSFFDLCIAQRMLKWIGHLNVICRRVNTRPPAYNSSCFENNLKFVDLSFSLCNLRSYSERLLVMTSIGSTDLLFFEILILELDAFVNEVFI